MGAWSGARILEQGATAAMDLSDGLLGDLPKILTASGVAARIDAAALPVAAAIRALFPHDWLELATRGGEDYELLFTIPPDRFAAIEQAAAAIDATVAAVGEVVARVEGEPWIVMRGLDGTIRPLADARTWLLTQGWRRHGLLALAPTAATV